jgi:hypothetical protein
MFYNDCGQPLITSDRLALGMVFVAIAVLACFSPAQGDTWWHLRAGFDIWHTHRVSLVDTYSYTAVGRPFPDHGWLSELYFAALYRVGGMPLVALGTAAPIVLAWALVSLLSEGPFEVRFATLVGGAAASTASWAIRPQVLSMLALALTATLLARDRHRGLPLVFLVWANVHGAVLVGLVAVSSVLLLELVRTRRVSGELTVITAACWLTTLCTPLGLRFWPEIIASLLRSRQNALVEWTMPGLSVPMLAFWMFAGVLIGLVLVRRRHLPASTWTVVAISLALLPLAVRSVRNVAMFSLVAAPAITQLARSAEPRRSRPRSERTTANATVLGLGCAVGGVIVASAWRAPAPMLGWRPLTPEAVATIRACPPPLYNTFEGGGALIWFVPEQKVFVDSRQDPYPDELLRAARQVESDGNYRGLFSQYGIQCAAVPRDSQTASLLAEDSAWLDRYRDENVAVFSRR